MIYTFFNFSVISLIRLKTESNGIGYITLSSFYVFVLRNIPVLCYYGLSSRMLLTILKFSFDIMYQLKSEPISDNGYH